MHSELPSDRWAFMHRGNLVPAAAAAAARNERVDIALMTSRPLHAGHGNGVDLLCARLFRYHPFPSLLLAPFAWPQATKTPVSPQGPSVAAGSQGMVVSGKPAATAAGIGYLGSGEFSRQSPSPCGQASLPVLHEASVACVSNAAEFLSRYTVVLS